MTTLTINTALSLPRGALASYLPLDLFPDALLAFSTRALSADWAGPLLRVRATDGSTDQGQADVLPSPTDVRGFYGLDSLIVNLDAAAVARGLTAGVSTLGNLVAAGGANYSGYCPIRYNQGTAIGANEHQATAASQPRVVNAGALQVDPVKTTIPVLYYDGANDFMTVDCFALYCGDSAYYATQRWVSGSGQLVLGRTTQNNLMSIHAGLNGDGYSPDIEATIADRHADGQNISQDLIHATHPHGASTLGTIYVVAHAGTLTIAEAGFPGGTLTIAPIGAGEEGRLPSYVRGSGGLGYSEFYDLDSIWLPRGDLSRNADMVAALRADLGA